MSYKFSLDCPTVVLLNEISIKELKRDDIAKIYALAILSEEVTDFKKVNEAIMERWSFSALQYIKEKAWKIIDN
jgi:hypothetical protein